MSIVYQVWEDKRMPTGEKISLEDDGIFPSERSWNSFITSNFGDGDKGIYQKRTATGLNSTNIFSWCISAAVAPEDLEFTFEYARGANFPTMVEIFVTAHIKEPG